MSLNCGSLTARTFNVGGVPANGFVGALKLAGLPVYSGTVELAPVKEKFGDNSPDFEIVRTGVGAGDVIGTARRSKKPGKAETLSLYLHAPARPEIFLTAFAPDDDVRHDEDAAWRVVYFPPSRERD